jgi:hypothetical protein
MTAKRIPALTVLTGAQSATDDKLVIFDATANETKAITLQQLTIAQAAYQRVQNFSGNGSTVAFTLSYDPGTENNTQVYVSGVYQQKNTYSVSGTSLIFSTAPPVGTTIEVMLQRARHANQSYRLDHCQHLRSTAAR